MRIRKIKIFKRVLQLLSALPLVTLTGLSGCTHPDDRINNYNEGDGNEVTITVQIPGMQIPTTRSVDNADEAVVEEVDILVFQGDPMVLSQHVRGVNIAQSETGANSYKVQFRASLSTNSSATTVAIIANVNNEVEAAIAEARGVDETKENILSVLVHASLNPGNLSGNRTLIPMYGEAGVNGITSEMNISDVILTRMLARIDVANNAQNFNLLEVYAVNYHTAGYIAPAWNADGTLQSSTPESPMIPSIHPQQLGMDNAILYDYTTLSDENGMLGKIYAYEAEATTGLEGTDGHTNAACLIIKGEYPVGGATYFYRIDFASGYGVSEAGYMPLLRNHCYVVNINEVNGVGYTDREDALRSLGVMNNLRTEMLVIDVSNITNTVFNSQHYLGIGNNVTFDYSPDQTTADVLCTTNYFAGWQIDNTTYTNGIEYVIGESGWLEAKKDPNADSSAKTANLKLKTLSTNLSSVVWEANVHLKAGKLIHKLKVMQKGMYTRVIDEMGDEVTQLLFASNNDMVAEGIDPEPQSFMVEWEPIYHQVDIEKIDDNGFTWKNTATYNLTSLAAGGSFAFSVDPAIFGKPETDNDPFLEKKVRLDFKLGGAVTQSVNMRYVHYNLIAENIKDTYLMNGSQYSFTVKANDAWTATVTSNPKGAFVSWNINSGSGNTSAGEPLSFTLTDDVTGPSAGSIGATTFDITFTSVNNTFSPVTYTIECVSGVVWAGSNIYWDGGKLTFDDYTPTGNSAHYNYQGVFFRWGSLWGTGPTTTILSTDYAYKSNGSGHTRSSSYSWSSVPYWNTSVSNDRSSKYISEVVHTPANVSNGIGDICKYLTEQGEGGLLYGKKWRLPTAIEFNSVVESESSLTSLGKSHTDYSWSWNGIGGTNSDGTAAHNRGVYKSKAIGTPYFPASGYRGSALGVQGGVDSYGCYMSSSSADGSGKDYFFEFDSGSADTAKTISSTGRALSVRCVRE